METLKLSTFLTKINEENRISLTIYENDKKDPIEELSYMIKFDKFVSLTEGISDEEMDKKVKSLLDYNIEWISIELEDEVAKDFEPYSVPVICLDISKDN